MAQTDDDVERRRMREDAAAAFEGEVEDSGTAQCLKKGADGVHMVVTGGVHLARDIVTDTLASVGDVGLAVIGTARDLAVGVADGVRDVINHLLAPERDRRQPPPEGV